MGSEMCIRDRTTGDTQTVFFSGEARSPSFLALYITIKEPGAEAAMDSATISMNIYDSRIEDPTTEIDETSSFNQVMEQPLVQALFGALMLFFLMGMLIIRGNASKARHIEERNERAREVLTARLNRSAAAPLEVRRHALGDNGNPPPPPPGMF